MRERKAAMLYGINYSGPIGSITVASDETSVIGLWIGQQKYISQTKPKDIHMVTSSEEPAVLQRARHWLDDYFNGEKPPLEILSLAPRGSEFQQAVWKILMDIPYGQVTSYGDVAAKVAKKMGKERMSAQAVGGAVGHNPISIIIPCHRVVGKDGNLTGYAGGLDIKIKLLTHEGVDMSKLFV